MASPRTASIDPVIRNAARLVDRVARKIPHAAATSGTPRRTTRSGPNSMLIGEGSQLRWTFMRGRIFGGLARAGGGRDGAPAARSDSEHGGEARPTGPAPFQTTPRPLPRLDPDRPGRGRPSPIHPRANGPFLRLPRAGGGRDGAPPRGATASTVGRPGRQDPRPGVTETGPARPALRETARPTAGSGRDRRAFDPSWGTPAHTAGRSRNRASS